MTGCKQRFAVTRFRENGWEGVAAISPAQEVTMSEQGIDVSEAQRHGHHTINLFVDGVAVTTHAHRLNGLQIRELGAEDRVHGFKTEIVSGHVRVIGDHEELDAS